MPNSYTSSNITATIPSPTDVANVTVGFEQYHASIADDINSKQATITGAATTVVTANLGANSVVVTNSTGKIVASSNITTSELEVLNGLTSQSQFLTPPGVIAPYVGFTVPDGWLFCNGASIVKSSYPALANVLSPSLFISEINYYSDGESGDDIVTFSVSFDYSSPISLVADNYYSVSLTANAAIRTQTKLAEIADFPASNTLIQLYALSSSALVWYGGLESAFIPYTWSNSDGFDSYLYESSQLGFTLNIYGTPGSVTNTVLPSLNGRFMSGSSSMANVSALQGSSTHTHTVTDLYAQIEREANAIVLRETGTISSWTPTDRVVGSSGAGNTTPTRTVGTRIGGSLGSTSHLPPYVNVKYIIKT
jgi:microcystin-dependent protein